MNAGHGLQVGASCFSLVQSSGCSRGIAFHVGLDHPFTVGLAVEAATIIVEFLVTSRCILVVNLPNLIRTQGIPIVADGSQATPGGSTRLDHPDSR